MKKQKGITLISLVIAVMVLMIVAGVVISTALRNDGQVKQVADASMQSFHDSVRDALLLIQTEYTSKKEFILTLKEHDYLDGNNKIEVGNLLKTTNCEYGNGSNKKDVYVLSDDLELTYYDKNGEVFELGNLGTTMEE